MPVIKVNDLQYALRPGQNRLGAGVDADVRVGEDSALGVQAIVELAGDEQAVIRRAAVGSAVRVNGIPLVEPTPLMHGDKVEIAGKEMLYSDDSKAGATQYVSASDVAAMAQKRSGPARATASTGGRLVSLVDGKEYTIGDGGITIGRDASCGVVVAENEASRKHAEVAPVERGYEVRDFSANGVFVNGQRIESSAVLSRADVIRVGSEEFRFYADVAAPAPRVAGRPAAATPPESVTPVAAAPAVSAGPSVSAPPASVAPPAPAVPAAPAAPAVPAAPVAPAAAPIAARSDARPILAFLEVANEGPSKGQEYEIRVPLVHAGRGAHNDICIPDDSVSDTHAKIQRRDDGWYVVDLGSTNGTYVGGQRLTGERKLEGAPDVRFGGVKMIFRPRDGAADASKGTRAIASVDRSKLRETAAPATLQAAATTPAPKPAGQGIPAWIWGVVALAVAGAAAFFLLNR